MGLNLSRTSTVAVGLDPKLFDVKYVWRQYLPTIFPIHPLADNSKIKLCRESWLLIKDNEIENMNGAAFFYGKFYELLFDRSEKIRHTFQSYESIKGKILMIIMDFLTSLNYDDIDNLNESIRYLAIKHKNMGIRPWMYSMYVETLILSVAECLGPESTAERMNAWTHVCADFLTRFLPGAIEGLINPYEAVANSLSSGINDDEVQRMEVSYQVKRSQKRRKRRGKSRKGGSRYGEDTRSVGNSSIYSDNNSEMKGGS